MNYELRFKNLGLKKIIIAAVLALAFFAAAPGVMAVGEYGNYGLDNTVSGDAKTALNKQNVDAAANGGYLSGFIGKVVGVVLSFIGILFFILMIYAGFMWMTAGGNEEKVKKAIDIIVAAAIGLIIIAGAYLITKFIGETVINPFK